MVFHGHVIISFLLLPYSYPANYLFIVTMPVFLIKPLPLNKSSTAVGPHLLLTLSYTDIKNFSGHNSSLSQVGFCDCKHHICH